MLAVAAVRAGMAPERRWPAQRRGTGGIVRYDLIIDGNTVLEDVDAGQRYTRAKDVIQEEYVPRIRAGGQTIDGMDQGDEKSVLILWDRVRTMEVRIRG
jgi:hypothetical protein